MSNFINDSLSKQIERGEVWFGSHSPGEIADNVPYYYKVVTGTKRTSLKLSVASKGDIGLAFHEGSSSVTNGGLPITFNMDRSSSNTIETLLYNNPGTPTLGTSLFPTVFLNGLVSPINALEIESGMILDVSSEYIFFIIGTNGSPQTPYVTWFLREL